MKNKEVEAFGLSEDYIWGAMADWQIPGLSIAVVKDGEIVYSRGFGLRSLKSGGTVDEHTLFTIGSCTKAFTAAAVALLVMEGKLSWDDPVRKFLPEFSLADPEASEMLTLRDIVSHRSGVEDGAITNIPYDNYSDAAEGLRLLQPMHPFRKAFSYNNTLFAVLGKVVEKVSGKSWEDFLQARILDPLAMSDTRPSMKAAESVDNRAGAHHVVKDRALVMQVKSLDYLISSAALQSSADDMARWLNFQLANGQTLLDRSLLEEMHSEQVPVEPNPFTLMMHPGSEHHAYAMAWFCRDYGATTLIQHGGYVDGYTSFTLLCPSHNFGVVVLTNTHNSLAPFALAYRVIDACLGIPETDWSRYFLQKRAEHRSHASPHRHENNYSNTDRHEETGKIGSKTMKTVLSFFGAMIGAVLGVYILNNALLAAALPTAAVITTGVVFGFITSSVTATLTPENRSLAKSAASSAITLGVIFLVFGAIAFASHGIVFAEMIQRVIGMASVGLLSGIGFHLGGKLHS